MACNECFSTKKQPVSSKNCHGKKKAEIEKDKEKMITWPGFLGQLNTDDQEEDEEADSKE